MKIKILTSIAGVGFSYRPGQTADFPDADAARMIEAGIAEALPKTTQRATKTKVAKK